MTWSWDVWWAVLSVALLVGSTTTRITDDSDWWDVIMSLAWLPLIFMTAWRISMLLP